MSEGNLSKIYNDAIFESIVDLVGYVLNDDSVPISFNLFANDIEPDPLEGSGQFEAPTFDGYAAKNFPLVGQDPNIVNEPGTGNQLIKLGPGVIWQPTGPGNLPQTIYGWHVETVPASTAYMMAGRFPEPITLTTVADFIEVEPAIRLMLQGLNSVDSAN